jgi:sec-independent protein translocase protein TatC
MRIVDHIAELRRRLLVTAGVCFVSLCAALICIEPLYARLVHNMDGKLVLLGPSDVIWVYFSIAGVVALGVTLPVAAFQAWRFVSPGLMVRERRTALAYVPAVFVQFAAGLSFGYFIIFPMVYSFLLRLASGKFDSMFTAEKYFSFLLNMTVSFALLFELPVVVMFLTHIGLLNPERLRKLRKPAYVLLVVTAVLITPPDFISDFLVTLPLLLLYEASIWLSGLVYRKRLKAEYLSN